MSTEISTVETTALVSHRAATNAAGLCRELVVKTAMKIQGRRYVQVEGWQAIANAFGCVASARNVERVEGGFRATGQVIRLADGAVIAEAEGFVGDDETTWTKRPVFARRAMAQTRAMSRACRSAFAFVVTLMDAGLETTPAEEMSGVVDATPEPAPPKRARPAAIASKGLMDDPAAKARLAINRATSLADLDKVRRLLDERASEGVFTTPVYTELVDLARGKAEMLIAAEQSGQEFTHEAAEHEVTA